MIAARIGYLRDVVRAVREFHPATREEYGAFYTPPATADFMVSLLGVGPEHRVLDPCAGGGAFIDALLRAGVLEDRITAWELDPRACAALRARYPRARVERLDALLDARLDGSERFDRIVANPPYLNKSSAYVRAHRDALRRRFGGVVGSGETSAMFLYLCLRLLVPRGRLSFIVTDTVRTLGTHERLRRLILSSCRVRAVAATPPRLFPGASVRTVILGIERGGRAGAARVLPLASSEDDYRSGAWGTIAPEVFSYVDGRPFLLEAPPTIVELFRQPLRFRDWVTGHIGMHTRNNRRYLAALAGSHLAERFDRRRTRPGELPVIGPDDARTGRWQPYLKEGGEKDFFFPIFEYLDWSPAARRSYVIPKGPDFGKPGLCVSGVSRRLSARLMPAGCYWDTNKVIGFVPRDPRDAPFLLGLLNSDLFTYIAKRLLNESSSMQINDLWKLPVPRLSEDAASSIARVAAECVERCRRDLRAGLAAPRRELDGLVFEALGICEEDRALVRAFVQWNGIARYRVEHEGRFALGTWTHVRRTLDP